MANIFENIDSKNKYKLLRSFRADIYKYSKNESVLSIVNENNNICLITKGSVKVVRTNESGNDSILDIIKENNIIFNSFISVNISECDILTNEDTEIISMNYSDVINYTGKNKCYNTLIKNLFIILENNAKDTNERISILTKKGIRNKLLEFFDILYSKTNSRNLYLPLTYTELADYIAVDRSAMSRELKTLKEEGFIQVTGKRITLLYR